MFWICPTALHLGRTLGESTRPSCSQWASSFLPVSRALCLSQHQSVTSRPCGGFFPPPACSFLRDSLREQLPSLAAALCCFLDPGTFCSKHTFIYFNMLCFSRLHLVFRHFLLPTKNAAVIVPMCSHLINLCSLPLKWSLNTCDKI